MSNCRRTKTSFDDLPNTIVQMLQSIRINYKETNGVDKLALYQAIVSRMLMRIFDEPLVVGMPDEDIYIGLRAFSGGTQHVGPEFREWKRATIRMIENSAQAATIRDWRSQKLVLLVSELEAVMSSISTTELTLSARSALIGIMGSAADLQRTLCLQKTEYYVVFFDTLHGKRHYFDERAMEPVNDIEYTMEDGSELYTQRKFAFCVFPCLKKIGTDTENIVFKARVCCGIR